MVECAENKRLQEMACNLANLIANTNRPILQKAMNDQVAGGTPVPLAVITVFTAITDAAVCSVYGLYRATGGYGKKDFNEFLEAMANHIKYYNIDAIKAEN